MPEDPDVSRAARRRTPGLRREEVAEAVGITVDWYARLEQGRVTPSERIVVELARVLRLEPDEREHLRRLVTDVRCEPRACESVPPAVRSIVAAMNLPAYVMNRRWDVLVWNDAASDLFMDYDVAAEADRNVLIYMMTNGKARALFGRTWRREARRMIALFRVDYDVCFGEPGFLDLERRLLAASPEFAEMWRDHEVRRAVSSSVDLTHRERGRLNVAYASFRSTEDVDLRLIVHSLAPNACPTHGRPDVAYRDVERAAHAGNLERPRSTR